MRQRDRLVSVADDRCDVLGGVSRGLPQDDVVGNFESLRRARLPHIVLVDGPVVMNSRVRKQRDIDGVVGMMMGNDHVSHLLGPVAECSQGVENHRNGTHHSRVDHHNRIAGFDQRYG